MSAREQESETLKQEGKKREAAGAQSFHVGLDESREARKGMRPKLSAN